MIGIDYSNFGPGLSAQFVEAALELMIRWTVNNVEGVNLKEMWALAWECVQSKHLMGNLVYSQHCGSPSGAPWTVIINTIVNQLYILAAWDALVDSMDKWNVYKDNVVLVTYGDDLIMTVKEEYIETFNQETIIDWLAGYRIVATDFSKEIKHQRSSTWRDIDFLQAGFRDHPYLPFQKLAPRKEENIIDITQWIQKTNARKEATRGNVEMALLQAYHLGPFKFKEMKKKFNQALVSVGIEPSPLQWEDIDDKFYGGAE